VIRAPNKALLHFTYLFPPHCSK